VPIHIKFIETLEDERSKRCFLYSSMNIGKAFFI
jgi:hypothetical protein